MMRPTAYFWATLLSLALWVPIIWAIYRLINPSAPDL